MKSCLASIIRLSALLALSMAGTSQAREITDMAGRTVTVPDVIRKAYAPSPYGSYMMYSVAPEKLAGLMFALKEEDKPYLHPSVRNLPLIGGFSGESMQTNIEVLMRAKPDVIVIWAGKATPFNRKAEEVLKKLNIPFVYATVDTLDDYPAAYAFFGKLMGKEAKTAKEAEYTRKTLHDVDAVVRKIPTSRRPKVYYAEGVDGLSTECDDSIHVQLMKLAGDVDVHRCHTSNHKGFEKISLEQVIMYNPDVIVAQEKVFYDKIKSDPAWRSVKAVRDGRVYLVPRTPFNWFDRPPSFMRILGLKWLMNCLYPKEFPLDIVKETKEFYKLFLGVTLSNGDVKKIVYR
ncbi:ABC transporter substrate-binding protein [Geobacter sp. AOG2]|uniref:ABC transporter substrate-binding protein n=1 Tax=Geobacter sp. AOG2 TaxID=1566347 RepID=UPI001CC40738|nr:ABC transporter substrate-binding protein [Geobacter sp. AOG2]GFE60685.1 ABC transporter substrate-binding protein [Geobacter sp. AOG2]